MIRAKRNTRQQGLGSTPSPTPLFFAITEPVGGGGTDTVTITVKPVCAENGANPIAGGDLILTGAKSTAMCKDPNGDPCEIVSVTSNGTDSLTYTFTRPAGLSGEYNVSGLAFDPAIRGRLGEWAGPFYEVVTVP